MDSKYYKISDSLCNTPCNGDQSQKCGGQYVNLFNIFNSNPTGNKTLLEWNTNYFSNI